MIRIRFVDGTDAVAAGIRAACYGFWAIHTEAQMPDGTLLGAHHIGSVQARASDYNKGKFTREKFVDLEADHAMTDRFHAFMWAQFGKPYDVDAIAAFVARSDWQQPGA